MRTLVFLLKFVLVAPLLLVGCGESTPPPTTAEKPQQPPRDLPEQPEEQLNDIVDTAAAADGFTTLVAAVKAAELVDTLKGDGPFTVFAPTDEAFAKLPAGTLEELLKPESKEKLTSILTYHVVPGKVLAADVVSLDAAKTVQGQEVAITVENGNVKVDGAKVTATDIECTNGVIHVIDAVILPK
jgi:transforming growth factor-beta-induced protein